MTKPYPIELRLRAVRYVEIGKAVMRWLNVLVPACTVLSAAAAQIPDIVRSKMKPL